MHRPLPCLLLVALVSLLGACSGSGGGGGEGGGGGAEGPGIAAIQADLGPVLGAGLDESLIEAWLDCPGGVTVRMAVTDGMATGECDALAAGASTLRVRYAYQASGIRVDLAFASLPVTVTAGETVRLQLGAADFQLADDDGDGVTNLELVLGGVVPGPGGPASDNAFLTGLALACGGLDPACGNLTLAVGEDAEPPPPGFVAAAAAGGLTDYTSIQNPQVTAITVRPAAAANGAVVTINDVLIPSGGPSAPIPLAIGINEIVIVVTAPDEVTQVTYRIFVTRLSPQSVALAGLQVSGMTLSPAFSADRLEYAGSVAFSRDNVTVTATTAEPSATIRIDGQTVSSGQVSDPIALARGENAIDIQVAIGSLTRTYRVTVLRPGSADLAALSLVGLTDAGGEVPMSLDPPFQAARGDYGSRAENRAISVEVMATAVVEGAEIRIGDQTLVSGARSEPIALDGVGEDDPHIIDVEVSHPVSGGSEPLRRVYRLEVVRQAPPRFEPEAYVKPDRPGTRLELGTGAALSGDGTVVAFGAPGEDDGAGAVYVYRLAGEAWAVERLQLSEPLHPPGSEIAVDRFGFSVALSLDGGLLAVGAPAATFDDPGFAGVGAVYLYTHDGVGWDAPPVQLDSLRADGGDAFGYSVAFATVDDAWTLAVGAPEDGGAEAGVSSPGDILPDAEGAPGSGAAYVFTRPEGGAWAVEAVVKHDDPTNISPSWLLGFGASVALSGNGEVLAVGMPSESSSARGINNAVPGSIAPSGAGAVFVYAREGGAWGGPDHFKSQVPQGSHWFGTSVALSAKGRTLAVGESAQASNSRGVSDTRADDLGNNAIAPAQFPTQPRATDSGAVYVFSDEGEGWLQQAFIKAANSRALFNFGADVALSADGDRLAVGAPGENSAATTIDGDPFGAGVERSGAAFIFEREDEVWSQTGFLKAPNSRAGIRLGASIAIGAFSDPPRIAAGAPAEPSSAEGIYEFSLVEFPADNDAPPRVEPAICFEGSRISQTARGPI